MRVRCALVLVLAVFAAMPVRAEMREGRHQPHVELSGWFGSDRLAGGVDLFVPLLQAEDWLVFTDLRGLQTRPDGGGTAREGNWGLGFRRIERAGGRWPSEFAWGLYAFADYRKSVHRNGFWQGTIGAEWLSRTWSVRVNGYLPERGAATIARIVQRETLSPASVAPVFSGTGLNLHTSTARVSERVFEAREWALPGVDLEVAKGFSLRPGVDLWLGVGAYGFDSSHTRGLYGPRGRATLRLDDLAGFSGTRLELGAELSHDGVRGTEGLATIRLRIPLASLRRREDRRAPLPLRPIDARMTERIVRDPDVVVAGHDPRGSLGGRNGPQLRRQNETGGETSVDLARDPQTGEPLRFLHVSPDGSVAGTGSAEDPVASGGLDLTGLVAATPVDRIILLHNGTRIDTNTRVNLQAGQNLVGAGATVDTQQGAITAPSFTTGARPLVNGTRANRDVFLLRARGQLAGFDITGGRRGIFGNNADDAILRDLRISGTSNHGLQLNNSDDIRLESNQVNDPGRHGVNLRNGQRPVIRDLAVRWSAPSTRIGLFLNNTDGFDVDGLQVVRARQGLRIRRADDGRLVSGSIDAAGLWGVRVEQSDRVRIESLNVTNSVRDALFLQAVDDLSLFSVRVLSAGDDAYDWAGTSRRPTGSGNTVGGAIGSNVCETAGATILAPTLSFADATVCP